MVLETIAAAVLSGNLLKVQILRPHPRSTEAKAGGEAQQAMQLLVCKKHPGDSGTCLSLRTSALEHFVSQRAMAYLVKYPK